MTDLTNEQLRAIAESSNGVAPHMIPAIATELLALRAATSANSFVSMTDELVEKIALRFASLEGGLRSMPVWREEAKKLIAPLRARVAELEFVDDLRWDCMAANSGLAIKLAERDTRIAELEKQVATAMGSADAAFAAASARDKSRIAQLEAALVEAKRWVADLDRPLWDHIRSLLAQPAESGDAK